LLTSDHSQFLSIRVEGGALHVAVLGVWTLDVAVTLNDSLQVLAARVVGLVVLDATASHV